jgi:hypothetical protein
MYVEPTFSMVDFGAMRGPDTEHAVSDPDCTDKAAS